MSLSNTEKHVKDIRREGINNNLYYRWSKDFLEAGKKRLSGDTIREASTGTKYRIRFARR